VIRENQGEEDYEPLCRVLRIFTALAQKPTEIPKLTSLTQITPKWSQEAIKTLKAQMAALKYLQSGVPIPSTVRYHATATEKEGVEVPRQENETARKVIEAAYRRTLAKVNTEGEISESSDPYAVIRNILRTTQNHKLLIPNVMPDGIDPLYIAMQREKSIQYRINDRISQLERIPANTPVLTEQFTANEAKPTDLKMKAIIELKALRLLAKQKEVSYILHIGKAFVKNTECEIMTPQY